MCVRRCRRRCDSNHRRALSRICDVELDGAVESDWRDLQPSGGDRKPDCHFAVVAILQLYLRGLVVLVRDYRWRCGFLRNRNDTTMYQHVAFGDRGPRSICDLERPPGDPEIPWELTCPSRPMEQNLISRRGTKAILYPNVNPKKTLNRAATARSTYDLYGTCQEKPEFRWHNVECYGTFERDR